MARRRIAVVTGANRGIGKAIVVKLASEGYDIACFGRDMKRLKSIQALLIKKGVDCLIFSGDVADPKFVNSSIKEVIKNFRRIDILVNNAGLAIFEKFVDTDLESFKRQIDANVYGVFNFSKAVIGNMLKRKKGTIVNIVSMAGKNGFKYGTTYSATKHVVMGFSKSLMLEVRNENIRVVTVCPGSVETDMIAGSPIHKNMKQVLKPNDIAEIVSLAAKLPERALISDLDIRPTNP